MKHMTCQEVIKKATLQWKTLRDDYVKTLEESAPVKRILTEEEKDVAFAAYWKNNFGEVYTLDEFVKESLKECAKRSKMSKGELEKVIKITREGAT
mgnify:CR=1 FL=1